MPDSVKTRKLVAALKRIGFEEVRQKGSHLFLRHPDGRTTLVPLHKEIRSKLLMKIIKEDLGMPKAEFFKLLC